jgi:hypothetical protein
MPAGVPAWAGDFAAKGHGSTYNDPLGGTYGDVGSHWLKYVLKGEAASKEYFMNDKMASTGWTNIQKKNLERVAMR